MTSEIDDLTWKVQLLVNGASTTSRFDGVLKATGKSPTVGARTGFANGLEIIVDRRMWANVPLRKSAPLTLDARSDGDLFVTNGSAERTVSLAPRPRWHSAKTPGGRSATSIGMLRGDRLGVTLLKDCTYFDNGTQCHFCAIKSNPSAEEREKTASDLAFVASLAVDDPVAPARHIYFNLGNTLHENRGLDSYSEIMGALRRVTHLPVHLNQTAPPSAGYLTYLRELGFDEVSFNIEFVNPEISRQLLPGKLADVPLEHCLDMLTAAVEVFRYPNVSSSIIVGVESLSDSLSGVEELMRRRVIPKLSIFRPLRGSRMALQPAPTVDFLMRLSYDASNLAAKHSVPLGPICDPCKMLSLAI